MEELHGHTLEYWKNNAEEDYLKVPISVLKYITCLEERIEQLTIPVVVGQSEQLFCDEHKPRVRYDWQKGNCLTCTKKLEAK